MEKTIHAILKQNAACFGMDPKAEKINVGFTNTIFRVNDSFILKICTKKSNENAFQKEIAFYKRNEGNPFIPKLYGSCTDKKEVPYFYEIIEKIDGVSLYNVWHTFVEEKREEIIKQLCLAMKSIHSKTGERYNWTKKIKDQFVPLYEKAKARNLFCEEEQQLLAHAYAQFEEYLESDDFVFVHNDLHFDNIFVHDDTIQLIDFERSMYAPRDFELDIFYRMIRKPWKFASEETEQYTDPSQYANIMSYIEKYYPELVHVPNLYERLAIYDMLYFLKQFIQRPDLEELKNDVLLAAKKVL